MYIRQFIREILFEDFESWKNDITNQQAELQYYDIQTIDVPSKTHVKVPRLVKQLWTKHADHQFFNSLNKVHWIGSWYATSDEEIISKLKTVVNASGRDEISTNGYLPGEKFSSSWGEYGALIQGRTTLASNDMDDLLTGFYPRGGASASATKKWKSSGFPRRASNFNRSLALGYILDRNSFDEMEQTHNELVVDNWKVLGFVINPKRNKNSQVLKFMKNTSLPVYDKYMNPVELS